MTVEHLPLSRQMDIAFMALSDELSGLSSGTVFMQIRNNTIGKFGVRHNPVELKDGKIKDVQSGLTELQQKSFRQLAIHALKFKKGWTYGEIFLDFTVRQNTLVTSIQFESNYNMASLSLPAGGRGTYRSFGLDS